MHSATEAFGVRGGLTLGRTVETGGTVPYGELVSFTNSVKSYYQFYMRVLREGFVNRLLTVSVPQTKLWERLADQERVDETIRALNANGFKAELVSDRRAALERVRSLIPDGADVMTGSSKTLDEIGLVSMLSSGSHPWNNLKAKIVAEKDRAKQMALRRSATFADYFVGSVQAITTKGEMVAGSASGSQLGAYAFGGKNLIIVAGTNKITEDLDEALLRLREHSTQLEDQRMKKLGFPGTFLSKILIYEGERERNVHVILVNEKLGF